MKKTVNFCGAVCIIVIAYMLCTITALASINVPEATTDFYVNDFANVFSEEQKQSMMTNAVALANENDGIQVVVTTIKSLEGATIEDYAYEMYNKYGIGKEDKGLLILLSIEDRKIRVEVGRAMEAYINDAKAGRFIDEYAISYLKENKFAEGLMNLQQAFIAEIKDSVASETEISAEPNKDISIDWLTVAGIVCIIIAIGATVYMVVLIVKKFNSKKEYIVHLQNEITKLKREQQFLQQSHETKMQQLHLLNSKLKNKNDELEKKSHHLSCELNKLKDRQKRAATIYPDVEDKIDAMIQAERVANDKQIAKSVDDVIFALLALSPSKDIVGKVNNALSQYNMLTTSQRQYVKADVHKLKSLQQQSLSLKKEYERCLEEERKRKLFEQREAKANNVTKEILKVISTVGVAKASDLYKLRDAMRLYDNLDFETKKLVEKSALSKLEDLISDAKRKKDEEEEEERRRKQNAYRSSSTYGRGSTFGGGFGGFGGRSGGGGSSRGF